jgi:AbrB family looped-hinge helix DNA binding protein
MKSKQLMQRGFDMSVSKLGQRRQVVIPKDICDELGIAVGDFLEVVKSPGNEIVIKPKKLIDAYEVLTPDEEKSVLRGMEQIKNGEYVPWKQVKDELGL